MTAALAPELLAGTQQIAHLPGWLVGHKARLDQSMGHELGQPDGVVNVGLGKLR
jgi:hypothetical protein